MAKLKIYNPITDEDDKVILSNWYGLESVCYKDISEFLDSMDKDDNDVEVLIHCPGGSCMEGWAIYDKLRTSGKNVTVTIEGMCASMASVILLAAPKERRFGFENASLLIHNPAMGGLDDLTFERLTADEIAKIKGKLGAQEAALIEEQNKILNLYVERTGADRDELQKLMNEDKFVNMDKAIELGFISATVQPNTASINQQTITKKMKEEKVTIASSVVKRLLALAGFAKIEDVNVPLDQTITSVDGSTFTVEREDGDPKVGDKASPDGVYTMEDGTIITIEGNVIKDITHDTNDSLKEQVNQLTTSVEDKVKQISDLNTSLEAVNKEKADLQKKIDDLTSANDTLKAENDKANEDIEALNATNADLTAKVTTLNASIETITAEKDALAASQKTEEEKSILDVVAKSGGKEWFDKVCNMTSTFNPGNRQFTPRGETGKGMTKTQQMLAQKKAEFAEKRNK